MSRRFDYLLPHWLALPPRVRRQLRAHHSTPPKDRTLARPEVPLVCGFARATLLPSATTSLSPSRRLRRAPTPPRKRRLPPRGLSPSMAAPPRPALPAVAE